MKKIFHSCKSSQNTRKDRIFRIGERHYLFRISEHCPHFVGSALAAWGDYCRFPKKSGADTFYKKQDLIRRKPLTETPRHGDKFSLGTPTSSSASAPHSADSTARPPNPVRQNAVPTLALVGFKGVLNAMKYQKFMPAPLTV